MLKYFLFAGTLLFTALSLSSYDVAKWRIIGQKQASYGADRDVLYVKGNDVFTALKLKITDAGLNMYDMDVFYENGQKDHINLQHNFRQGEESRVIDLQGNRRRIEKISFLYDTKGIHKGKANIIVFGRR
ncbi:MAG: DUF2541 family protein [Saprospiraceae bacterium]|nr:DUF2541 family protein [Saprospiraceae bacterium]